MAKRRTVPEVTAAKGVRKLSVVTAYDFPSGGYADQSGVDMILVGDSLGMVILGHEDTLSVTMDEMIHHSRAVAKAAQQALVVGDMPFMSYHLSVEEALFNAGRFMKEARVQAVKLEGGKQFVPQVRAMVDAGIPVMGHLGLTPQRVHQLGGYKVQGREERAAARLIEDAGELAQAGCFAIVLECVPKELARKVTESIDVPTIGIGAGPHCDGQVLVFHDLLGMCERFSPKFVKNYALLGPVITDALKRYREEVERGEFPGAEHCYE
ncbi:MAG: 3-methyl-2-oxobutanoate hydroxymethyltransferase [Desulfovibrionales bacterium]